MESIDGKYPLIIALAIGGTLVSAFVFIARVSALRKERNLKKLIDDIKEGRFQNLSSNKSILLPKLNTSINNASETPLLLACKYGSEKSVVELLEMGSSLEVVNKNKCNALHLCCWEDNHRCLEEIINYCTAKNRMKELESLINQKSENGFTPLHIAAAKNAQKCLFHILDLHNLVALPINEVDDQGHTIFMMATANTFDEIFYKLIQIDNIDIHKCNAKLRSALFFASVNCNLEYVKAIIERAKNEKHLVPQNVFVSTDLTGNTPIHAACLGGSLKIVQYLLSNGFAIDNKSKSGDSPIHICVNRGTENCINILKFITNLIDKQDNNHNHNHNNNNIEGMNDDDDGGDGILPSISREKYISMLLDTTNFGSNPLHDASFKLNYNAIEVLMSPLDMNERSEILNAKDNDGLTPLHSLCRAVQFASENKPNLDIDEYRKKVLLTFDNLMTFGADVNGTDHANANSLHLLCYSPSSILCIDLLKRLFDYNINPFQMDNFQWLPLHALIQTSKNFSKSQEMIDLLRNYMLKMDPESLDSFDATKKRDLSNDEHLNLSGAHQRIPINTRNELLNSEISLQGIAHYIQRKMNEKKRNIRVGDVRSNDDDDDGNGFKVVVMCGAGISVNAGIPDFRSRNGLYSVKGNSDIFSLRCLIEEPARFYSFIKANFLPLIDHHHNDGGDDDDDDDNNNRVSVSVSPTLTHSFFKLLEEKKILKRIYTQNIDMLEYKAKISNDLVVTAHGSFASARCLTCFKTVQDMYSQFWKPISRNRIPICKFCNPTYDCDNDDDDDHNSKYSFDGVSGGDNIIGDGGGEVRLINGLLRPDIVFFGEPLTDRYSELHYHDLSTCDLLIVLGTSLVVYPFAGLLSIAPLLTPRVLINREISGPFTKWKSVHNYRDVVFEGDCDSGVEQLSELLGWKEELISIHQSLNKNSKL